MFLNPHNEATTLKWSPPAASAVHPQHEHAHHHHRHADSHKEDASHIFERFSKLVWVDIELDAALHQSNMRIVSGSIEVALPPLGYALIQGSLVQ